LKLNSATTYRVVHGWATQDRVGSGNWVEIYQFSVNSVNSAKSTTYLR